MLQKLGQLSHTFYWNLSLNVFDDALSRSPVDLCLGRLTPAKSATINVSRRSLIDEGHGLVEPFVRQVA